MKTRRIAGALVACGLLLAPPAARAACTISVSGVSFGAYSVFGTVPLDTTGTIVYTCDRQDKRIRVTLSPGSSGTYATRTMTRGADHLDYNLFINGFTVVWGDGRSGTDFYSDNNPPNSKPVTLTIFGRIFAQQDVGTGLYTDSVEVQIDF